MELFALSAAEMVRGIKAKEYSASEVFASCLSRIEALEPELSALLALTAARGREEAARVDGMIARATIRGPLPECPWS